MNLRRINAVLSLITTVLILDHAIFYTVWMFSRGTIEKSSEMAPRILAVFVVVHAILSLAMAVLAHKGEEKKKQRMYPKLNRKVLLQRMTGMLMLALLFVHAWGAVTHFHPKVLHAVLQPVFFGIVLLHVAISVSKACITLGIGNARFIKIVDIVMGILCAAIFVAGVIGFYLCLIAGVAR